MIKGLREDHEEGEGLSVTKRRKLPKEISVSFIDICVCSYITALYICVLLYAIIVNSS